MKCRITIKLNSGYIYNVLCLGLVVGMCITNSEPAQLHYPTTFYVIQCVLNEIINEIPNYEHNLGSS